MNKISRLREARRIANLSQKELAERTRLTQQLISNFEREWLLPGPELRKRIADSLLLPVEVIFPELEDHEIEE